jgi:hypothetical protein
LSGLMHSPSRSATNNPKKVHIYVTHTRLARACSAGFPGGGLGDAFVGRQSGAEGVQGACPGEPVPVPPDPLRQGMRVASAPSVVMPSLVWRMSVGSCQRFGTTEA